MTVYAVELGNQEGLLPYMEFPERDVTTPYLGITSDRQFPNMVSVVLTEIAEVRL